MKEVIAINIKNNTSSKVPVSLFGNNADLNDNSNATTRYQWNLTGFSVTNEDTVEFQAKGPSASSFSIYNKPLSGNNIQSIIDTLNSFELGTFFLSQSGGNTYIENYSDSVVYGYLNIYNRVDTNVLLDINMPGAGGDTSLIIDGSIDAFIPNPAVVGPTSYPAQTGDLVQLLGTSNAAITKIKVQDTVDGTFLVNDTVGAATPFNYSFTISQGRTYLITVEN